MLTPNLSKTLQALTGRDSDKTGTTTPAQSAVALIAALEVQAGKIVDHWFDAHPDAPEVGVLRITISQNGTFFYYPKLRGSLPAEIRAVTGAQMMQAVGLANQLRGTLPDLALPITMDFHLCRYLGSSNPLHKPDGLSFCAAGLAIDGFGFWEPRVETVLDKIVLIAAAGAQGASEIWEVLQDHYPSDTTEDLRIQAAVAGPVHAPDARTANFMAASRVLSLHELSELLTSGQGTPHVLNALSRLRVMRRQISAREALGAVEMLQAEPVPA